MHVVIILLILFILLYHFYQIITIFRGGGIYTYANKGLLNKISLIEQVE